MKLGSFLGFYCFFPKLIVEFLNKVGASDLFLSSCKICFSPPQLVPQKAGIGKIKGERTAAPFAEPTPNETRTIAL